MSDPCSTTKELKRNPLDEEPQPGTSRDNHDGMRKSCRKRKASTSEPPLTGLADNVKAKLKVKLSKAKSSKKKSKKSSKEKKSTKGKSSKGKKSSKKTAEPLSRANIEVVAIEIPEAASAEARSELPAEVLQITSVGVPAELPAEFLQASSIQAPPELPAEILQTSSIETCTELPAEILQVATVETSSERLVKALQTDNVEILNELPAEVLMSMIVEVHDEMPAEAVKVIGVEVHSEPDKVLTSATVDFCNEVPLQVLKGTNNIEIQNDNLVGALNCANTQTSNNFETDVPEFRNHEIHQSLQSVNDEKDKDLDCESCADTLIFSSDTESESSSSFEKNVIGTKYNKSETVVLNLDTKVPILSVPALERNEKKRDSLTKHDDEKVHKDENEAIDTSERAIIDSVNERNLSETENVATTNDVVDLNDKQELALKEVIRETLGANHDSSKENENEEVIKDLNEAMDTSKTASNNSNNSTIIDSDNERNLTETENVATTNGVIDLSNKQGLALKKVIRETLDANHESFKEHENEQVTNDQNEAIDTCEAASNSTIIDSDNERNFTETKKVIMTNEIINLSNKQELALKTVTRETLDANHDSSKEYENEEVTNDQSEAIDTCETVSNNSTRADSDNERNLIEAENTIMDEVLLGFNSRQEAELKKITTRTTNVNLDSLEQQKDNNFEESQIVAMDTCEDFHNFKMIDLATNNNGEFPNEHRNEDTNYDQNNELNQCEDIALVEEIHSAVAVTEAYSETFNEQTNEKASEEQNKSVDLPKSTKENKKSNSRKSKASKSKSSKSNSKSGPYKSTKSTRKKRVTAKSYSKNTRITRNQSKRNRSPYRTYKVNEKDDVSCRICEQTLNTELRFYSGEPANGCEEELGIIDSRLLLFNGDEESVSREDTRAYNKLTSFSVYCQNGHLCPFDSGLIEQDVEIYFSGYIKPIYSDDSSIEGGVPGKDFGPIAEWWTTGFDIGEQPTVAFSTEIGDYVLMEPSEEYKPFMQSVLVKSLVSKIVIEYLVYEPHATYEDLLNKLQSAATIYDSLSNMTEDVLLQYAPFICMQVMSYDETAKPNEPLMLVAPCIRRLIDLAGISFKANTIVPPQRQYHERRAGEYRKELLRRVAENREDRSFTSQLIDSLLPGVEEKLTALSKPCTRTACGNCDRCQRSSCNECETCMQKNYENCIRRRCFYREIQEANDEDIEDSVDLSQLKGKSSISVFKDRINIFTCFEAKLSWLGNPLKIEEVEGQRNTYYAAVQRDGETICIGDFVFVHSVDTSVPPQIVKVAYFWEENTGLAFFHANHYWWGKDTVLGELARSDEVFSIDKCGDMSINCITNKVTVCKRTPLENRNEYEDEEMSVNKYFCEKSYDPIAGYFHDLPKNEAPVLPAYRSCINCEDLHRRGRRAEPRVVGKLEEKNERKLYRAIKYKDEEYIVGSFVYLKPKSLYFRFPMLDHHGKSLGNITKKMDEEKYPELYRKIEDNVIDLKSDLPAPFDIGQIAEIFITDKLYIKVKKLYRPENTHRNEILIKQTDMNMLYWSNNEVCTVPFSYVIRKCYVAHVKDITKSIEEWSNLGSDRFYFSETYCDKKFENIDKKMCCCEGISWEVPRNYTDINAMMSLQIFAGCGGLSLGLRDAGIINKFSWAIESDVNAADTFKLNNPTMTVLVEHPDVILTNVINGKYDLNGSVLPHKGDVEFLCATLPCENYKDMTDISIFKHSAIATFLSYCNHYKPSLFILEADEKFIKRSVILKLTLACFVSMGYQVTFDLMQIGSYGAPQNRRRSVILGAAPGHSLPKFPERLHVFPKSLCQLGIVIDSKKYIQKTFWTESAPYRSVTVRDALIDLPSINVERNEHLNYEAKSPPYFARMMRLNMLEPTVSNHVCKDLGPLVECRITQIPLTAGSDWRNLPNIEMQLRDGSLAKKIIYNYDDVKAGKSSNGALRGVCSCVSGEKCNPHDRQHGCLIPWHLVHSATRNNQWAGIYSRLQWEGFFNGAITNPQPLGTQGLVLHPTQPRTVSVRECARGQGFPDNFILPENISIQDMYQIIGRASSPLLGRAIGHEIARSLITIHHK